MASSVPYDPYLPSSGQGSTPAAGGRSADPRIANIQGQLDNSVNVMNQNIQAMADRGERLDSLQNKTDQLAESSGQFKRSANTVRKRMWWKDTKMRICLVIGVVILIVVIVAPIATLVK